MTLNSRDNRQLVLIELNASEHSPHCTHTHGQKTIIDLTIVNNGPRCVSTTALFLPPPEKFLF